MQGELILTGRAAECAARLLLAENGAVRAALPGAFLRRAKSALTPQADRREELSALAGKCGLLGAYGCGKGGILAALWYLAEELDTGLCANLAAVPIAQEVIELFEAAGEDPYRADSSGCTLFAVQNGAAFAAGAEKLGVPASRIGFLTDEKPRTLRMRGHIRYLDNPRLISRERD